MNGRPHPKARLGRAALALAVIGALLAGCSTGGDDDANATSSTTTPASGGPTTTGPLGSGTSPIVEGIRIEVLSSQPDRVTGDDARIRVTPPPGAGAAELQVRLDDTDVTRSLEVVDGSLEGVVEGFVEGNNSLTASDGTEEAVQRIRAWPLTGPVFSGPHAPLLACATEDAGLGPASDDDCSAATKVTWQYIDDEGGLRDLASMSEEPADIGRADIGGKDVPLYVRVERGVRNRAVYELAAIDPTPGDQDPSDAAWNGTLLYRYGGGPSCAGLYGQGTPATTAVSPTYLKAGYVVATASFNDWSVSCNDVLSAETTMMVKERAIEAFGSPRFTIGEGASGGAIQVHLIIQNYPGLLNGAVASNPFPDALTTLTTASDCTLLDAYFSSGSGSELSPTQRKAIAGTATSTTCKAWVGPTRGALDPTVGCDPSIAAADIYDPDTGRGVRCTIQDASRNQFGSTIDASRGDNPLDNVGVQYGLEALNAGTISVDEFIDLNEAIGGLDDDAQPTEARTEADPEVVLHAYETGRVSLSGGDLLQVPIIDLDAWTDPSGDIHDQHQTQVLRERITFGAGQGEAPGVRIWTRDAKKVDQEATVSGSERAPAAAVDAVEAVARWLDALRTDQSGDPLATVLEDTRPNDAVDSCDVPGTNDLIQGDGVYEDADECLGSYPSAGSPRMAAGGPPSDEALKCALKPVDPSDYDVALTEDDLERIEDVFPDGVCDWSIPGTGETIPANPDRSYEDVTTPQQNA